MKIFAKRLVEARKNKKMTQTDLAKALFLDKSTIAKYETDEIDPSIVIVVEIAKLLEVSTDYLLGLSEF